MRVLWFATNPSGYKFKNQSSPKTYGSWTSSLQSELTRCKDITLGVCFCTDGQPEIVEQEGVIYYPIPNHRKKVRDKILDFIFLRDVQRDKKSKYHQSYKLPQSRGLRCANQIVTSRAVLQEKHCERT